MGWRDLRANARGVLVRCVVFGLLLSVIAEALR